MGVDSKWYQAQTEAKLSQTWKLEVGLSKIKVRSCCLGPRNYELKIQLQPQISDTQHINFH